MMSSVDGMEEFHLEPALNPHRIRSRSASKDSQVARQFQLIISFPSKYPHDGVLNFTVRASLSVGGKISGVGFEDTALIVELSELARRHALLREEDTSAAPASRMLIEIAKCFRCRVLQIIHGKPENIEDEQLLTLVPGAYPSTHDGADIERDSSVQTRVDVIESKAYRIPCPVTSAGKFSPRGFLLCFGSPDIEYAFPTDSSKSPLASASYPKTYADMLLMLRDEEDMSSASSEELNEGPAERVLSRGNSGRSRSHSPDSFAFDGGAEDLSAEFSESSEISLPQTRERSATKPWSSTDSWAGSEHVSDKASSKRNAIKHLKKKIDRGMGHSFHLFEILLIISSVARRSRVLRFLGPREGLRLLHYDLRRPHAHFHS